MLTNNRTFIHVVLQKMKMMRCKLLLQVQTVQKETLKWLIIEKKLNKISLAKKQSAQVMHL